MRLNMAENKRLVSKEEFLELLEDEEYSPGWQAIDDACDELYNELKPYHFATNMVSRAIFGGEEFLDGYSIYRSPNGYMHIVTYGMTELYGNEEAFGGEWNGWGYEMTPAELAKKDEFYSIYWSEYNLVKESGSSELREMPDYLNQDRPSFEARA